MGSSYPLPSRQAPSGREGLGEQPNPPSTPQVVRSVSLILVGIMAPANVEFHPLVSARCPRYGTSWSKRNNTRAAESTERSLLCDVRSPIQHKRTSKRLSKGPLVDLTSSRQSSSGGTVPQNIMGWAVVRTLG